MAKKVSNKLYSLKKSFSNSNFISVCHLKYFRVESLVLEKNDDKDRLYLAGDEFSLKKISNNFFKISSHLGSSFFKGTDIFDNYEFCCFCDGYAWPIPNYEYN